MPAASTPSLRYTEHLELEGIAPFDRHFARRKEATVGPGAHCDRWRAGAGYILLSASLSKNCFTIVGASGFSVSS